MPVSRSSSTLSRPRTPTNGPVYRPWHGTFVVVVVPVEVVVVVEVVVGFVAHTLVPESNLHASSPRHSLGDMGWWVGSNKKTMVRGLFPGSYVELIKA